MTGGGAQEAATPGQALAATVIALLEAAMAKDRASRAATGVSRSQLEGEALGLDAAAVLVQERLTPAWEAANRAGLAKVLAECARYKAERDEAREALRIVDADRKVLKGERDMAREELATCRERNAAIAVQLDQYRDERDRYRAALERGRHVLEEHDEPDDDARRRALAIICAALEAAP